MNNLYRSSLCVIQCIGRRKCREVWPDDTLEKCFTVFLDVILLIIPLFLMVAMYGMIVNHLWKVDQGKLCVRCAHLHFYLWPPTQLPRLFGDSQFRGKRQFPGRGWLVSFYCWQLGAAMFR